MEYNKEMLKVEIVELEALAHRLLIKREQIQNQLNMITTEMVETQGNIKKLNEMVSRIIKMEQAKKHKAEQLKENKAPVKTKI